MKLEQYYRVENVALGVMALLAATGVWIELTAPETGIVSALLEILWLSAMVYLVVLSVRRRLGIISNPRVRPWMVLAFSLLVFFALFLALGEFESYGLAKIVSFFRYLVLALFSLFVAIVKYYRLVQEPD